MKNPLLVLSGVLSFGWLLFSVYLSFWGCPHQGNASAMSLPGAADEPQEHSIYIADKEGGFEASAPYNFVFPIGNCEYLSPLPEALTDVFQELREYMNDNPDRMLVVTGLGHPDEENKCDGSDNLGLSRAKLVTDNLAQMGLPAKQMKQAYKTKAVEVVNGKVFNAVKYSFVDEEEKQEEEAVVEEKKEEKKERKDVKKVESRLRKGKMVLYFEKNEMDLKLTPEQQRYFNDLKYYIRQKPKAKILVSGHTDNHGKDAWNRRLSRKRAEFVGKYLSKKGIPSKNIITKGYGPTRPIASNETTSGRKKNRRVEVTIR